MSYLVQAPWTRQKVVIATMLLIVDVTTCNEQYDHFYPVTATTVEIHDDYLYHRYCNYLYNDQEVLSVPHRFLPESGDSGGFHRNPEECKLAGGSAKIAIPVIPDSAGILTFRN